MILAHIQSILRLTVPLDPGSFTEVYCSSLYFWKAGSRLCNDESPVMDFIATSEVSELYYYGLP